MGLLAGRNPVSSAMIASVTTTSPLLRALLQMEKRAERVDEARLVETFVDTGSVLASLENQSNQIIYGRRGTGKTHAIRYLGRVMEDRGHQAIYLSLDHIGSSAGLYADLGTDLAARATRLLVDVIASLHDGLFEYLVSLDDIPSAALAASDALCESITQVRVEEPVTVETSAQAEVSRTAATELGLSLGKIPGLSLGAKDTSSNTTSAARSVSATGIPLHRVHLGETHDAVRRLVESLSLERVWFLLDEWSSVPLDLQPYLADMLRRVLFTVAQVTVKIAAIEYRSQFRTEGVTGTSVGAEVGADVFADLNLDDYMVFNSDADRSASFSTFSCFGTSTKLPRPN